MPMDCYTNFTGYITTFVRSHSCTRLLDDISRKWDESWGEKQHREENKIIKSGTVQIIISRDVKLLDKFDHEYSISKNDIGTLLEEQNEVNDKIEVPVGNTNRETQIEDNR